MRSNGLDSMTCGCIIIATVLSFGGIVRGADHMMGDMNCDGSINSLDIDLFVECLTNGWCDCFKRPLCSWAALDPGDYGVGTDPDGYNGGVFDGRYVYFAPGHNGTAQHGEVLRYDMQADFFDPNAWATFDPGENSVGTDPDGYAGAVFDGQRYIYFAPFDRGSDNLHGEVLRYDTWGEFAAAASWLTFDPGENGVGIDPDGFMSATFDGQYVYFVPYLHHNYLYGGEVLRYNTAGDFDDPASWTACDPYDFGNNNAGGYRGAVYDGQRYLYFVPTRAHHSIQYHGEVARYDTWGDFCSVDSWEFYDAGANGVGSDPDGYIGGTFDGRYIYFAPHTNEVSGENHHGEVLRYDTEGAFNDPTSWATFDVVANGIGEHPVGFTGAIYDEQRFVYFVPHENDSGRHGEVLRHDTWGDFGDADSWDAFEPANYGVGFEPMGYSGGVFDGRHIYFVPNERDAEAHGEVLRYDTQAAGSSD